MLISFFLRWSLIFWLACNLNAETNLSSEFASFGIQPPEIEAWEDDDRKLALEKAVRLSADIAKAVESGIAEFTIPKDDYLLKDPLVVGNAENMKINGSGATFWLAGNAALVFSNCVNCTVENLTIDRLYYPFVQAVVREIVSETASRDRIIMELERGSMAPNSRKSYERTLCRSAATGKIFFRPAGYSPDISAKLAPGEWEWTRDRSQVDPVAPALDVGDRVAMHAFVPGDGLNVFGCGDMHFIDISVYSAGGFLVKEDGIRAPGNNQYTRLKIIPRPGSSRVGTSTRDGFHSYNQSVGPTLVDCEIAGTCDDGINIHGFMNIIVKKISDDKYFLASYTGRDYEAGTTLMFYQKPTMKFLARATVLSFEPFDETEGGALLANAIQFYKTEYNTRLRQKGRWPEFAIVTLDQPVDAENFDLAVSSDYCGAGARITNLYIHDGCNRGVLIKAPSAIIEESRFENIFFGGLYVAAELGFVESDFADNVVIRDNLFTDCAHYSIRIAGQVWSSVSPLTVVASTAPKAVNGYLHIVPERFFSDLTITGNTIENSAGIAMFVANAKNTVISDNIIDGPLQNSMLYQNLDLTGIVETNYGAPVVSSASFEALSDPLFGIYIIAGENITVQRNQLRNAPAACKGAVGVGPWASNVTVEN